MKLADKRIVFIDMDGTLIETITGSELPKGCWDMKFKLDVWSQLARMQPNAIFIVTNQGGIEKGFVNEGLFSRKFAYVISALQEFVGMQVFVGGRYCATTDRKNIFRKPNLGMVDAMYKELCEMLGCKFTKKELVMIGDASDAEKNFSDDDARMAKNYGIDYYDVNDFVKEEIDQCPFKIVVAATGETAPFGEMSLESAQKLCRERNEIEGAGKYAVVNTKFIAPLPPKQLKQPEMKVTRKPKKGGNVIKMTVPSNFKKKK